MGEARDIMDRATAAVFSNDMTALAECYAADVVAQTPDAGTINGRDNLVEYMRQMADAFPDLSYEMTRTMEDGRFAIDEGTVVGTNTGPLVLADGRTLPATRRSVRLRSVDVATVEGGVIISHDFYFDQMAFIEQLGLMHHGADA